MIFGIYSQMGYLSLANNGNKHSHRENGQCSSLSKHSKMFLYYLVIDLTFYSNDDFSSKFCSLVTNHGNKTVSKHYRKLKIDSLANTRLLFIRAFGSRVLVPLL